MAAPDERAAAARPASWTQRLSRLKWRGVLRAVHRDAGYLAVGLTLIYALSGLAVNHIADWDPNFTQQVTEHQLQLPLPADPEALADRALRELGLAGPPSDVYAASADQVEVQVGGTTLHINPTTGHLVAQGQKARPFLRIANWLHLNRGKKAWTYVADAYAVCLLYLSVSGLFMVAGRKGLLGRGGLLVLLGILVPVIYVVTAAPPGIGSPSP